VHQVATKFMAAVAKLFRSTVYNVFNPIENLVWGGFNCLDHDEMVGFSICIFPNCRSM